MIWISGRLAVKTAIGNGETTEMPSGGKRKPAKDETEPDVVTSPVSRWPRWTNGTVPPMEHSCSAQSGSAKGADLENMSEQRTSAADAVLMCLFVTMEHMSLLPKCSFRGEILGLAGSVASQQSSSRCANGPSASLLQPRKRHRSDSNQKPP